MLMVAGWVFMTMGYFWGKGLPFLGFSVPLDARFWLAFASYSLEMGVVYVINQIRDIESDRANRKLLILPDGLISVRGAWWWTGILFVASAALSVLAGWQFLVIWAISGIIGFLYSDLPNLKGLPIPNITMNMLGYGTVAFAVKFAYRVASFTLALFVGVRFPVFALLAALSWAGARAYYWLRFGIKDYPSFTGK